MTETRRTLGHAGPEVTRLGMGGAPLGGLYRVVSDAEAEATLDAAWSSGVRYFDTAPWYGTGLSEHRVGAFLRRQPRESYVLSTKVGRVLRPTRHPTNYGAWFGRLPFDVVFDYSRDGIIRSYEDSLQRLGLDHVDAILVHDLEPGSYFGSVRFEAYLAQLATSGRLALDDLRSNYGVTAIGAGVNVLGAIPRLLDVYPFDFFILAMRYNLMEQDALDYDFPLCAERGVSIVGAAVLGSGLLATGPVAGARYNYVEPNQDQLTKAQRIQSVCARYDVPLVAAAIQFPLAHPVVQAVVVGAVTPAEARANSAHAKHQIPAALWSDLKQEGLVRPDAPTPDSGS